MSTVGGPRLSTIPTFQNTYSMDFDGVDDYVDCGDVWDLASEPYTWSPFTLSFWYKGSNPIIGSVHTKSLFEFMSSQFIGFYDGYLGAANIRLYLNFQNYGNSWVVGSNGTVDLFDNQWHNVVIVLPPGSNDGVDTVNSKMYIDNTLINKAASAVITPPAAFYSWKRFKIMEGAWDPLQGTMDEVALWKTDKTSDIESIYNSGVPTDLTPLNPIAWYRMGDNGAYKDPQWLIPNNENKDKVSNYSMEFDGVNDYVSVPNLSISGASPRTMTCWFKTTSSVNQNIMGFGTTSNGSYFALTLYNSGGFKLFGHTWNLGAGGDLFGPVVSLNDWHFAVLTYDGVTLKISLDGSTFATTTATLNTTNTPFLIGDSAYTGWSNFTGDIDEVAIWDYALTQTEINAIYNGGKPTTISGAVAHYKMGEEATFSTNWTVPDQVGSNDGTSANMTIEDRVGTAPSSSNNAVSFNMDEVDRTTDVPT